MAGAEDERVAMIPALRSRLLDRSLPMPKRFRTLFSLMNVKCRASVDTLLAAFDDPSALFRHEVAFCLGQMQDDVAVPKLKLLLEDVSEHSMVRHEAAEALGAIGTPECLAPLRAFENDPTSREVAQTCQLALQRIERGMSEDDLEGSSPYKSVDPAFAAPASVPTPQLKTALTNESAAMLDRYAALFALRNRGGKEAVAALSAAFGCESALLKHEVCYVFGQMQDKDAIAALACVLADTQQHPMVRHEAAEALGAIAAADCTPLLQRFRTDPEIIVAESCDIALDILEYETSGSFQYADTGSA